MTLLRTSRLALALAAFISFHSVPTHAANDLAQAYKIIKAKQFVDLTHSFSPTTPVWSGFGQAVFTPAYDPKTHRTYTIKHDRFHTTYYNMVGQYGTHVDPPAHFADGGKTMDQIPLKQMNREPEALQGLPVSGLVVRIHQIPLRTARRDRHRS